MFFWQANKTFCLCPKYINQHTSGKLFHYIVMIYDEYNDHVTCHFQPPLSP